ncbi:hypothetical protein Prudu_002426 [Prunus dulcis]|uniref:Uncharacterized protein n=1 Tax=Prunus dulcis TaxID=3755 RepID=A0A4Y1QQT6_PRUDU|nr:hypothetical protein Prudu_002426 [Prunus dulcis]
MDQIRGRLWGALCTQYWEGDNLTQEEIKRDTTVVITVFHHRTAAGLEAIELELVLVEKPARMMFPIDALLETLYGAPKYEERMLSKILYPLSLFSPSLSLSSLSLLRAIWVVRPFAFQGTVPPPQAEPISAVGTYGSAFVSPSQPDRPQPRGRPELAGKLCFPAEVPPKLPKLPARNSPSFLHQIDRVRHQEPDRILKGDLRGIEAVEVRGIHHRANYSFRAKVKRFGNGQNTGETLPNFRQKSTEILKRI